MVAVQTLKVSSSSPDQTCQMAQGLAPHLCAGDIILLTGDVGAGKTHFARCAILASLEKAEDVPSPTYTLVQTYPGTSAEIWHADLYRLTDTTEVAELGLLQAFSDAICLIEWPDRLGDLAPPEALHLTLTSTLQDARDLTFTWSDPRWAAKLESLANV